MLVRSHVSVLVVTSNDPERDLAARLVTHQLHVTSLCTQLHAHALCRYVNTQQHHVLNSNFSPLSAGTCAAY